MTGATDMSNPVGQGNAIRGVHRAKQQTFDHKQRAAGRKRKDKKKKKEESPKKLAHARGSKDKRADSEQQGKEGKHLKPRGTLLDLVI
jgi:hypothetical protein